MLKGPKSSVWAEDFTEIVVDGSTFKLALLIDVFTQYILGWALARRATEALVAIPVRQALAANAGQPPDKFLFQDNGRQYVSESHNRLLDAHEIIARNVPAYTPQYNGAMECGGKEFKNVFYNVWEQQKRIATDKEKTVDDSAQETAAECVRLLNGGIPRPFLGGVTPADVHGGMQVQRQNIIEQYRQEQEAKGMPPPLSRSLWDVIKDGVKVRISANLKKLQGTIFQEGGHPRVGARHLPEVDVCRREVAIPTKRRRLTLRAQGRVLQTLGKRSCGYWLARPGPYCTPQGQDS